MDRPSHLDYDDDHEHYDEAELEGDYGDMGGLTRRSKYHTNANEIYNGDVKGARHESQGHAAKASRSSSNSSSPSPSPSAHEKGARHSQVVAAVKRKSMIISEKHHHHDHHHGHHHNEAAMAIQKLHRGNSARKKLKKDPEQSASGSVK